ncbi:ABC transporter ATP-binding protein, partial [Tenacibaculum sp.]|nr:ABC transporter ATP-binding protein [Tenacibaculum sp.]
EKTSKTIIISTHEANLAIQLADNLILFSEKDIYQGSSQELINQNLFEELFSTEYITFNKTLKQFIIKKV